MIPVAPSRIDSKQSLERWLTSPLSTGWLGSCDVDLQTDASAISFEIDADIPTASSPLLRGREFDERDSQGATPVAVINETMATQDWPGEDPLGQWFRTSRPDALAHGRRLVAGT